ncbi:expressed unknown protein [Seminavis robusta]|uniref:Uncharacterized protein n=1 Tax=Seminavis robusta TaxID=568900 RepID=A0A9N8D9N8_9STRA|nr:expressed unknown protein [Seminavis robusta]|eukprot:Sro43_g026110.1 n/a (433) ;mRNA; r:53622-54920
MNDLIARGRDDEWALESFDFGLAVDHNHPHDDIDRIVDIIKPDRGLLMNDCSHADTLSTAGESSSWGSSCEYQYTHQQQDKDEPQGSSSSEEEAPVGDLNDSERSLSLDDLKAFFVEDQVGVFDPTRDDIPPPKARTDFKGDSQNSFTLDDLTSFTETGDESENDTQDSNNNNTEGSLGCLLTPNKRSSVVHRKSKRKSSLVPDKLPASPLKGILKNGTCNTRRSSSLTMLLMEDSTMLQMSLSNDFCADNDASLGDEGWSLNQQSFGAADSDALDLQALLEKRVQFSTVLVHEHALIVGDNPSVHEGVPLSLGWKAQHSQTYENLEAYESDKKKNTSNNHSNNPKCKCTKARRLDAEERLFRLLNAGVSLADIQKAEARTNRIRGERDATKQQHLLLQGGLHTKTTKLFWKALQRKEDSDEDYYEGQANDL